ncbi:DsbA family protein [Zobellella aerophila]|uniref:DsbA family protein n=1 Tax=Zobellella aerophila TaxID=870480 RepID=A0ABP6VTU4_9GAMM
MKKRLLLSLTPLLMLSVVPATQAEMSREEFQKLVRETLLEQPEILREAIIKLEENDRLVQQKQFEAQVREQSKLLFANKTDGIMGNPAGSIEMVYFTDYNCPYCRRLNTTLLEVLKTEPELKVIVKDVGILGPDSVKAARLALAAAQESPKLYEELHQAMMSQQRVQAGALESIADKAGLEVETLQARADSKDITNKLNQNMALFRSLGLNGTPALVFPDGTLIPGAIDTASLQQMLQEKKS